MIEEPFFVINEFLDEERRGLNEILETLKGPKFNHYERSIFLRNFTNDLFNAYRKTKYKTQIKNEEEKIKLEKLKLEKQKELLLMQLKKAEELRLYKQESEKMKKDVVLSKVTNKALVSSKFFDGKYEVIEPKLNEIDLKLLDEVELNALDIIDNDTELKKLITSKCNELQIEFTDEYFDNIRYYLIRDIKRYGKLSPLLEDKNVKEIICNGSSQPLLVTYEGNTNVPTNVSFISDLEINNLIKHFVELNKQELNIENPFVNIKIENFEIQATLGSEFFKPKFVITKNSF